MAEKLTSVLPVDKLCRICGNILSGRVVHNVNEHLEQLKHVYKEDFSLDSAHIHPKSFCHSCYSTALNCNMRGSVTEKTPVNWTNTSAEEMLKTKTKGGRPPKSKRKRGGGRPKKPVTPPKMTLQNIMSLSPSKPIPKEIEECMTHVLNIKMQ